MRGPYRILQICITLVNIAVAAIVITSILPFSMGQFQVTLPENEQDVDWHYSNGIVTLSAPIGIDNGGFYAIRDVMLHVSVTNSSGFVIVNSTEDWGTIYAGEDFAGAITISFNLIALIEAEAYWMIFNPDYFEVEIVFNCKYTFKLVKFRATYDMIIPWDGLIRDIGYHNPSLVNQSGNYSLNVSYYVWTNELIPGNGGFSTLIYNDTSADPIAASGTEQIAFGTNHSDELSLSVNDDVALDLLYRNQTLRVVTVIDFDGFSVEDVRSFYWEAPVGTVI